MEAAIHQEPGEKDAPHYPQTVRLAGRDKFLLELAWDVLGHGSGVIGRATCLNTQNSQPFKLDMPGPEPSSMPLTFLLPHELGITVKLMLEKGRKEEPRVPSVLFFCELPVSSDGFEKTLLGEWEAGTHPIPPEPHDPDPDTVDHSIGPVAASSDVFPFVWLQPLSRRERADAELRFVSCKDHDSLPLYRLLQSAGSADAKRSYAKTFQGTGDFVGELNSLAPPVAKVPAMGARMLAQEGAIPLEKQVAMAREWLELPPDTTLADTLAGPEWRKSLQRIWQSVFTLALIGTPEEAGLGEQLVYILRGTHYLTLLLAGAEALIAQAPRHTALHGIPSLPDPVAAQPPQPNLSGSGSDGSQWQVLGVGQLSLARQHAVGYALGELAEVVNVMPRERQASLERHVEREADQRDTWADSRQDRERHTQQSLSNELADTVAELMSAGGLVNNMTDVKPSYENLNLTLSGSWAGSKGDVGWASNNRSQVMQSLIEQAANRLGKRVGRRRSQEWQRFHERLKSQVIDNSQHDRLVGLYHWIDQVVRVRLEHQGKRLVLSFLIPNPAAPWLAQLAGKGSAPLVKPPSLPAPAAGQPPYSVVTAENYRSLGLQYGLLDLAPPPAATLARSVKLDQGSPASQGLLVVPEGYKIQTGNYMALADGGFDLMCMIADTPLPAIQPATPGQLTLSVPSCTSSSIGPASLTPSAPTRNAVASAPLPETLKGATGTLPITLMSGAPNYTFSIAVTCTPVDATASEAQLAQWQARIYERIHAAWRKANGEYQEELARRIDAAATGHGAEIQRNALQQSCLALLTGISHTGTPTRSLADLFAWQSMTWEYQPWPLGNADLWPEMLPGENIRPASPEQFQRFLHSPTASVLVPVAAGREAWVLYYLQFQQYWSGGPASVPITASTLALLEEIQAPPAEGPTEPSSHWTLRLPTTMLYLQEGKLQPWSEGSGHLRGGMQQ